MTCALVTAKRITRSTCTPSPVFKIAFGLRVASARIFLANHWNSVVDPIHRQDRSSLRGGGLKRRKNLTACEWRCACVRDRVYVNVCECVYVCVCERTK